VCGKLPGAGPARVEETNHMDHNRLSMPLGEAIFTQRSIRRFKPDPIPVPDIRLILEAAVRAPNGGNQQIARFLVVNDRTTIREFGDLYHEAWWAKRHDEGFRQREDLPRRFDAAARLADAMADVPCIVFALALRNGPADSVVPAVQNLMLAARAIGVGSVPTTLHPSVMDPFPQDVRHPGRCRVPFLRAARLPRGQLRPECSEADLGDDVPQPLGRSGPVELTRHGWSP
jgi:Nitroreductase family